MKTDIPVKVGYFLLYYMGKWAGGHSFAHQHGCHNINVSRFSKLLTAVTLSLIGISTRTDLKITFKTDLFTSYKNFV